MTENSVTRARWAIMVHGGAHEVPADQQDAARDGCLAALQAGRSVLEAGGSAVDAVEAAVRVLEDRPVFNAGYGSAQNEDGEVETQASVMDGRTLDVGAVAALKGVRNPVKVAARLLRDEAILLVGDGANRFARECSAELCDPNDLIASDAAKRTCDTVGCVALDAQGHVAAAVSTGGLDGQRVGRVGDSPQPGCGFYAEDKVGAVALTGEGERIARMMSAGRIMGRLAAEAGPAEAIEATLSEMTARIGGEAGGIALTADGQLGWWHNSPHMPVAFEAAGSEGPKVYLTKQEEGAHGTTPR
ncbi:isoaspartyl peptidase/L-asparaginase family protein [Deinococcus deserti]|uniref:Putative asparaginase (L-asparaginase) n=1 Tax=Deinococcus deserti (strain DSM 17065 / CIP 109153 / LMG 22923 / VCD115) TaxID=546414 RepID=C1D306_DEIDV|nr:isoaspartyl peptidase/L-asparaginase family protein [Deinococcus deserti]ACO47795.2 putative asparaginase (L-asparaginase) [Deinococcus deserti VCD115]